MTMGSFGVGINAFHIETWSAVYGDKEGRLRLKSDDKSGCQVDKGWVNIHYQLDRL